MKKRILLVFLAIVLVVSLAAFAACKAEEEPPVVEEEEPPVVEEEEPPVVEEVWEWPKKLVIGTPGLGGLVYATDIAWTAQFTKMTGVQVRVVPEENEALKHKLVQHGRTFMCGMSGGAASNIMAEEVFATVDGGPFQLRQVWTLTSGYQLFMVRGDSDIKTLYDLKPGVKLPYMAVMPAMLKVYEGILAWAGLTLEDAVEVPFGTFTAMLRSIPEGKTDICFCPDPAHAAVFEAAAAPHGLRFIDLDPVADPEGAARLREISPTVIWGACTYGIPEAIGAKGIMVTSPHTTIDKSDPELVYHLAKWLHENFDVYKDKYFMCNQGMSLETFRAFLNYTFTPVHEGTIRYLKEIGQWTEADDLRQEYNVNLVTRYIKAYQEAIDKAGDLGIPVTPANEEWLELWENYKLEIGIPEVMSVTDAEIRAALGR